MRASPQGATSGQYLGTPGPMVWASSRHQAPADLTHATACSVPYQRFGLFHPPVVPQRGMRRLWEPIPQRSIV